MSIAFLALLFPQKCAFCGKLTAAKEQGCCRSCRRTLPYTDGILRLSHSAALLRCAAPLYYTGSVRSAVLRLKFGGRPELARAFAVIVADETIRAFGAEFDLVTWVPVSAARLRERGFDQAKLIAEYAARRLGLKAVQLLIKTQDTPAQSTLRRYDERRANIRRVYAAAEPEKIQGKRVLLIDDVCTTGATLDECSRTLKKAGAVSVDAAVLARSEK
jgi:ComF family protein